MKLGDVVLDAARRAAVEGVLEPGSAEAEQWNMPQGGVLIKEEEGSPGVFGRVMLTLPDG